MKLRTTKRLKVKITVQSKITKGMLEGRLLAIKGKKDEAAFNREMVLTFLELDIADGMPKYGRRKRLREKMDGTISKKTISRILDECGHTVSMSMF